MSIRGGIEAVNFVVTDLAALAAVRLAADGMMAYVYDYDDIYTYDSGAHVADGLGVIAAIDGGYWIAQTQGRYDDLFGSVAVGNAASALTNEVYRDTPFRMLFFRHDQDDALHFVHQFSHKWRLGTDVYPHIHIVPMADPLAAQNIYFEGQYAWSYAGAAGQPIPANAGWTSFSATHTVNPGDVYKEVAVALATVTPPAWAGASANLLIYLIRAGTNPLDTYTTGKDHGTAAANVGALFSDVHYRASRMGTITEYV